MVRFLQSLLMAPGPFYFYPWKPVVNHLAGDSYEVGYKHFKTGHRSAVNLSLHTVCLFVQVFGNFALLNAIEKQFAPNLVPGVRVLTLGAAAMWSLYLLATPAPLAARVLSTLALVAGYFGAPHVTPSRMDAASMGSFAVTLLISNFVLASKKLPIAAVVRGVAIMAGLFYGFPFLERTLVDKVLGGPLPPQNTAAVFGAVATYLFGLALAKNPLSAVVVSGVAVTRLAAAATGGNEILFFWSYGFAASLFQGIAHRVTKEEATLLAMEREDESDKLKFEWSHVTYFPNLLWNAVIDASSKRLSGK